MERKYAVKLGNCFGRCPEVWVVGNDYKEHSDNYVAVFDNEFEAQEYIRLNWGVFPVTC